MPVSKHERRRRIFLAARTVFVGTSARLCDNTAIKSVISKYSATFQSLKQSFGEIVVLDVIRGLLENGILESGQKAKLAFPELYQPSPARNLQHDASEQEAARSEVGAMDEALRSERDTLERYQGGPVIDVTGCSLISGK